MKIKEFDEKFQREMYHNLSILIGRRSETKDCCIKSIRKRTNYFNESILDYDEDTIKDIWHFIQDVDTGIIGKVYKDTCDMEQHIKQCAFDKFKRKNVVQTIHVNILHSLDLVPLNFISLSTDYLFAMVGDIRDMYSVNLYYDISTKGRYIALVKYNKGD